MAKRKGGFGILPFVAVFLGLLAAGATAGLFSFYNKHDKMLREEKPKWEADLEAAKRATQTAVRRWNELAPWVLDSKYEKPEDFDASEEAAKKEIETQIIKVIDAHLGKDDWGTDAEARKRFILREKLKFGDVVKKLAERVTSLEGQLKQQREAADALDKSLKSERGTWQAQQTELQGRITSLQRDLTTATQTLATTERNLRARELEYEQKSRVEAASSLRKLADKDREYADLKNENQRLKEEKVAITQAKEAKTVALERDGEVTGVAQALGLAYINLGRHHRVQRGMRFTVFAIGRGGVPRVKGDIEVRTVGEDSSKVGILSEISERDPIVVGDLIANPAYRPDAQPTFVLCGEMERYSREDMGRLIEENGGHVAAKVSPSTDFVVVGGDVTKYEGDSLTNYREALQLGLRMMSEKELLQYLPYYGGR